MFLKRADIFHVIPSKSLRNSSARCYLSCYLGIFGLKKYSRKEYTTQGILVSGESNFHNSYYKEDFYFILLFFMIEKGKGLRHNL